MVKNRPHKPLKLLRGSTMPGMLRQEGNDHSGHITKKSLIAESWNRWIVEQGWIRNPGRLRAKDPLRVHLRLSNRYSFAVWQVGASYCIVAAITGQGGVGTIEYSFGVKLFPSTYSEVEQSCLLLHCAVTFRLIRILWRHENQHLLAKEGSKLSVNPDCSGPQQLCFS